MSDIVTSESLNAAVALTISRQILHGLDTKHRDALLEKSIVKALNDYEVRCGIEKVVAQRAGEIAQELAQGEAWTERITQAVRQGFEMYQAALPQAIAATLAESLHGKEGDSYERRGGLILKHLKLPKV